MKYVIIVLLSFFTAACTEATTSTSSTCTSDNQCAHPRVCRSGSCIVQCFLDTECLDGEICLFNRCEAHIDENDMGRQDASSGDASNPSDSAIDSTIEDMTTPSDARAPDTGVTVLDTGLMPPEDASLEDASITDAESTDAITTDAILPDAQIADALMETDAQAIDANVIDAQPDDAQIPVNPSDAELLPDEADSAQ